MKATAIILAGGQSRRMSYNNKAFLDYEGKSFIEHIIAKVKKFDEIIIVAHNTELYKFDKVKVVQDVYPDAGPLCGLYSGLLHAKHDRAIVLTVDAPFIVTEMLEYMVDTLENHKDIEAVIPVIENRSHPLIASYSKSTLNRMNQALMNGTRKMQILLNDLKVIELTEDALEQFGDPAVMFRNINTPEEYEAILEMSLRGDC